MQNLARIETLLAMFARYEISEARLSELLGQYLDRNDRAARPARKATMLGPLWQEP